MQSTVKFQALNGCSVSRKEVEQIVDLAKLENNTDVVYRLSKVLLNNPDIEIFKPIEIIKYPATGLNGMQHTGEYKEALDNCGRLRPGFKFQGGKVVKVQPKVKVKTAEVKTKKTVPANVQKKDPVQPKPTKIKAEKDTPVTPKKRVSIKPNNQNKVTPVSNSKKIKAKEIKILWAEGDNSKYDKFPKSYKTFADAHAAIIPIYNDYLKSGALGYNKVKFFITFEDGETYEGRLDVSQKEDNPMTTTNVIGVHVYDFFDYLVKISKKPEEIQEIRDYLNRYSFEDFKTVQSKSNNVKVIKLEPKKETVKSKLYDFIFEVSHNGGYLIKSFLDLPISKSIKNKKISDTIEGLFTYNATENGLKELKKAFPNNAYADKGVLSSKDLNKPLSLFGAKKKETIAIVRMTKFVTTKRQGSFGYTEDEKGIVDLNEIKKEFKNPNYRTIFFDKYGNGFDIDEIKNYNVIFGEQKKNAKKKFLNGLVDGLVMNVIANSLTGAKKRKPGLKSVVVKQPAKTFSNNSRVKKIGERSASNSEFYTVAGEVGKYLQRVEKKPFESVVITIDGPQGAGKTTMLYQFMDAFASPGNKSLFISGEEHPESELAIAKTEKYISSKAKQNLDAIGKVNNVNELYSLIAEYDIIFFDSWQKLLRMIGNIRLDEDLRQKFNGKVFVIIFQQTTTGRTKGGSEVVFDGDIVIKMVKSKESFAENYAFFDKNRYTLVPLETIHYNIAKGSTFNPLQSTEIITESTPAEKIEFSFNVK